MPIPILTSIEPSHGRAGGGDLVRLVGAGFAERVAVRFGGELAEVVSVHQAGAASVVDLRTPAHGDGVVDVELENLGRPDGLPVAGERVVLERAYRFLRPRLTHESHLTRLVRTLLRALKRDLLENALTRVSVDYADARQLEGVELVPVASLPALVLTPVELPENRTYSTNELRERVVVGPDGPEIVRDAPPRTVDVELRLTGSSDSTIELLNLLSAVASFVHRTKWIEMARDPEDPEAGTARWELRAGPFRTMLDGPDGVGAFTVDLVVRAFDLADDRAFDRGAPVRDDSIEIGGQ